MSDQVKNHFGNKIFSEKFWKKRIIFAFIPGMLLGISIVNSSPGRKQGRKAQFHSKESIWYLQSITLGVSSPGPQNQSLSAPCNATIRSPSDAGGPPPQGSAAARPGPRKAGPPCPPRTSPAPTVRCRQLALRQSQGSPR